MNLLKEKITDKNVILKLIPHRAPMIMVDSLCYYDDTKVISGLTIMDSNIFVKNQKLMEPGLIEHMAQSVALYSGYHSYVNSQQPLEGYIGAIKRLEIHRLPSLGNQLETEIVVLQEIMDITLVQGTTRLNNDIIMTAQMKTVLKK